VNGAQALHAVVPAIPPRLLTMFAISSEALLHLECLSLLA